MIAPGGLMPTGKVPCPAAVPAPGASKVMICCFLGASACGHAAETRNVSKKHRVALKRTVAKLRLIFIGVSPHPQNLWPANCANVQHKSLAVDAAPVNCG